MYSLKIKNNESLLKIFKTVSLIDSWRWNHLNSYGFVNLSKDDLTNSEKVLTHWICYITDRQMPFEIIWDKGGYIFSELVYEYSRNDYTASQIITKFTQKYKDDKGIKKIKFISLDKSVSFASRYVPNDIDNILRTLKILSHPQFGKNIIKFIILLLEKYINTDDLLIRITCWLHILTYQLKDEISNGSGMLRLLDDTKEFDKRLNKFKAGSKIGKKRLWCCVRDYKKGYYHKIFKKAVKEVSEQNAINLTSVWDKLPFYQLELPGDVWNNSPLFRDNMFAKILNTNTIPKSWGMPIIVRELYSQAIGSEDSNQHYPEQFDFTFDFVEKMCNQEMCSICFFGPNGAEKICIPTNDKYCPVALITCGYFAYCVGKEASCLIKEGLTKGICKARR